MADDAAVNNAQAIADRLAQQGSQEQFPVSSGTEHAAETTTEDAAAAVNNKRPREDGVEDAAEDDEAQMRKRASFTGPEASEVRVTAVLCV